MIFLTVGTYPIPFDRLVKTVDIAIEKKIIKDQVFAQIGICNYKPKHMKYCEFLEKNDFDSYIKNSSCIISHAGMGTITMSLDNNIPLIVMPRLKQYKEHVNDHQLSTANKFEELGHILVFNDENELEIKINKVKEFKPKKRISEAKKVAERIGSYLESLLY